MNLGELFDGKYRILNILGKGGMGTVYLAENIKLGTLWAIKEIDKALSGKFDILVEPNILKKLNHPALPRIFDILEDGEFVYIIVDYIEGEPLDKLLAKNEKFDEQQVIPWVIQICDVLAYLHNHQPNPVIYRDLKPANVILSKDGSLKLIDFGIARENKRESELDTTFIGTRGYASPEQYGTGQTNAASDIYSLGVTMYHLLTGIHPNDASFDFKPLRNLDRNISTEMEAIVAKCIRTKPSDRYQSARELLEDMRKLSPVKMAGEEKNAGAIHNTRIPKDYKKVVGLAGSPDAGTTTVAVALSEYFAAQKRHVILADFTKNRRLYDLFGWGYANLYPKQDGTCRYSLENLIQGRMTPVKLDKYRDLYITDHPVAVQPGSYIDIVDLLRNSGDVVIFDMDFYTDVELVKHLNHLYLVKDMNMYRARENSEYLNFLKSSCISLSKLRVIISKYLECEVKPKNLLDVVTTYDLDDTREALTDKRPPYFLIPFEPENYRANIENIYSPLFTCDGFTQKFCHAIQEIGNSVLPMTPPVTMGERIKSLFIR